MKSYLKLQKKYCLNKNISFSCIEYHLRNQFCSILHFKYVMYVPRNPQSNFIGKFRSIRRKLRYQVYLARNKTAEIMEEVCEVSPKNLRKNFWVE